MSTPLSSFSHADAETRSQLPPAVAYYIRKLLHQNLDCLSSVVAEGAGMRADSLSDLNSVIESLYVEPAEVAATIQELERLAVTHQTLSQQGSKHRQELGLTEKQIFWLLGYRISATTSSYRGTILVVDDTPNNLRLLTSTLSKQGYEVSSAISGQLAIASIRDVIPDLILLDIMMPDMDGYEVCKQLKSITLTRDIPVIFVSAIDNPVDKVKAFQVGAVDYLIKPFQIEEVIARIDNQLKLRDLQKRLAEQNLRLEQEIRQHQETEAKYRSIFENSIDGIFQTTADGQYISVNPALAQLYGYTSPAELMASVTNIGHQLYVQPGRREGINAYLQQHGQVMNAESEIHRQDGSRIWISEDIRIVKDSQGNVLHYEGTVRDITERRQIESELRQQRNAAEHLLLNIVPKSVAIHLRSHKAGIKQAISESIVKAFNNAAVMIVDIPNFSLLSRQITPNEQVKVLNQLFSAFDELVDYYSVEKVKSVRHTYIVVGGIASPQVEPTIAIANLALDIQALMPQLQFNFPDPLQLRIGISTGAITAGIIGTKKFTYDIWGDTVDLADQMRSQVTPGKIQVTSATYERLKEQYQLTEQAAIELPDGSSMTPYLLLSNSIPRSS